MNELNLAVYTNKGGESAVTLNAKFATHEEAVSFHEGIAELCKRHSIKSMPSAKLLGWAKSGS